MSNHYWTAKEIRRFNFSFSTTRVRIRRFIRNGKPICANINPLPWLSGVKMMRFFRQKMRIRTNVISYFTTWKIMNGSKGWSQNFQSSSQHNRLWRQPNLMKRNSDRFQNFTFRQVWIKWCRYHYRTQWYPTGRYNRCLHWSPGTSHWHRYLIALLKSLRTFTNLSTPRSTICNLCSDLRRGMLDRRIIIHGRIDNPLNKKTGFFSPNRRKSAVV